MSSLGVTAMIKKMHFDITLARKFLSGPTFLSAGQRRPARRQELPCQGNVLSWPPWPACAQSSPSVAQGGTLSTANATIFGPNVYVFDPSMPAADIQNTAAGIFSKMEANQFGSERYALLFKPGKYDVTFNVGFYTHVAGLGRNPDDVQINGGVNVNAQWMPNANATCNFWRTLENFAVTPSSTKGVTRIAVSQAAPLRRLHVKGDLHLFDFDAKWNAGWASGGFLADSVVDGKVVPASQQQWLSRNSKWSQLEQRRLEHGLRGLRQRPGGHVPQPALHRGGADAHHPRKALPLRRRLRPLLRLRSGAADQHPGRQLGRRPHAGRRPFPSIGSTSPSPRRPPPPASTPRWPRASTSSSPRASTRSTTR